MLEHSRNKTYFNSLKEGASKASEWFEAPQEANELTASINAEMEAKKNNGK